MMTGSAVRYAIAAGVGLVTALIVAALMLAGIKAGISPLPKPLGLAFADAVFDARLPLAVGFVFHAAWVIAWTLVFVYVSPALRLRHALGLAAGLWISALVVFMPLVGWGFLGLNVTPKLIVAAVIPHVLFALLIWAGCRMAGLHTMAPNSG